MSLTKNRISIADHLNKHRLYTFPMQLTAVSVNSVNSTTEAPTAMAAQSQITAEQWHIRLAHASLTVLRQLNIQGFGSSNCEICIATKMTSTPHSHSIVATAPLEVVSMDVWDPATLNNVS
jgi:hypothetical protein